MSAPSVRCTVAYATRARQYLWEVSLPAGASIAQALAAARAQAGAGLEIPWDSAVVGVFGEPRPRTAPCVEGDRIELYRPLACDPRARRRERVQRERGGRAR